MAQYDDLADYYAARAAVYDETAGYTDTDAERARASIKTRYREFFRGRDVLEVACGTGYWTRVLANTARSVLAVDVSATMISRAQKRVAHLPHVKLQVADAYTLDGVRADCNAAFAHWWWSHIPLERTSEFLAAMHGKLSPGAIVMFVDQLPYDAPGRRRDRSGNIWETRMLPDGRSFEIIKNFPCEQEIHLALSNIAENIRYVERPDERSWDVTYNTRG